MTRLICILLKLLFSLSGPAIGESSDFDDRGNAASTGGKIASQSGGGRQFKQVTDQTYFRVFSGESTQGGWLTAVPPESSAWGQEVLW